MNTDRIGNDPVRETTTVYIGLGSNLQQPAIQLIQAFGELDLIPQTRLVSRSGLYSSPPMGPKNQPNYVNAVARLESGLDPHALLRRLQDIEQAHRRERVQRWGPRTLDLDLLLYGQTAIDTPELRVPHPGLRHRSFVLYPLYEISPGLGIPGQGRLSDLVAACPQAGLQRLD